MSSMCSRSLNSRRKARGLTTAPERRCEPGCLPFSITATGTSPSRSAIAGAPSSSCPSRIAQASPAGPAPTIATPTSIRSSSGSVGREIASLTSNGGGNSDGLKRLWSGSVGLSGLALADELGQLGHDLVQVADHTQVGVLDRRSLALLVRLLDHPRLRREVLERDLDPLDLRLSARLGRIERPR